MSDEAPAPGPPLAAARRLTASPPARTLAPRRSSGKERRGGKPEDEGGPSALTRDLDAKVEASLAEARRAAEQQQAVAAARRAEAQERRADVRGGGKGKGRREQEGVDKRKVAKGSKWNESEKRKRDNGQASRGKSTVEESKRQAREMGVYSGFD